MLSLEGREVGGSGRGGSGEQKRRRGKGLEIGAEMRAES